MSAEDSTPSTERSAAEKRKAIGKAVKQGRFPGLGQVLTRKQLAGLPKPEPLIEDWLDLRTSVVTPGDTGSNKTFAVLGWACSVATGVAWLGHEVKVPPSPVVFVVGEGAFGLDERITAWEAESGKQVRNLFVLKLPSSIAEEDFWSELHEFCGLAGAVLVILDTFSSLAPGADETDDAAMVVRRMNELAVAIDGTVVLTHHTGWENKGRARGGTQLESDPDSVIIFKKDNADDPNTPVTILRKKNKEGPAGATLRVERRRSADSCVLARRGDGPLVLDVSRRSTDKDVEEKAVRFVTEHPGFYGRDTLQKALGFKAERARALIRGLVDTGRIAERSVAEKRKNGRGMSRKALYPGTEVGTEVPNLRPAGRTVGTEVDPESTL